MLLIAILAGTLAAGIGSVWLAAALSFGVLARYTQHMLSLAAGALMGTAFLHLLPEAFESQLGAHQLFLALLIGLVFFFLLDALWARLTGRAVPAWKFQVLRRAQWQRFYRAGRPGRAHDSEVIDAQVIELASRPITDGRAPQDKAGR